MIILVYITFYQLSNGTIILCSSSAGRLYRRSRLRSSFTIETIKKCRSSA